MARMADLDERAPSLPQAHPGPEAGREAVARGAGLVAGPLGETL